MTTLSAVHALANRLEKNLAMRGSCGLPSCPPIVLVYSRDFYADQGDGEPPVMACWRCGRPAIVHTVGYVGTFYHKAEDAQAPKTNT